MPVCLDCGAELGEEDRYCPSCGSPGKVVLPTDAELRKAPRQHSVERRRRTMTRVFILILLVGLLIFAFMLSRMISTQMDNLGSGFY